MKLLKFWPLLVALASLLTTSAVLKYQVMEHDKRITKLEMAREKWVEKVLDRRGAK